MSSAQEYGPISSHDLNMLRSLLSDAGFESDTRLDDDRTFNKATRKIIDLFQGGMTDPSKLKGEMLFLFGVQKRERMPARKPLARYAIQGLPEFGR
ncbi:hypothetical protein G6M12_24280 [Agrobacterium tumefaciens]|uniref:hypothetical protein n=1 Tax=Rhizobium/Agrobacterium group TaxID=227290 RepID=UPI00080FE033|nr:MULTISPECIES: hypothetical protein [Rhizobium/Agrobacterium group]MBG0508800.1 hypothetical protein [Agrobacterium leguminum]NTE84677.1 hypothetical protein [Agrobacterium tumefaciens]OCJ70401.1 hypothetical protein A6U96_04725 [Agrobacterium tumefaciens]TKV75329.1 hypothetical protein D0C28_05960 [Rhizobium sp. AU243]